MKRYDVLEAHLGDREYKPGDTRIMDPSDAAQLVEWGLIREASDQAFTDDVTRPVEISTADQIDALTKERDDLAAEVETLRATLATAEQDRDLAIAARDEALAATKAGKSAGKAA